MPNCPSAASAKTSHFNVLAEPPLSAKHHKPPRTPAKHSDHAHLPAQSEAVAGPHAPGATAPVATAPVVDAEVPLASITRNKSAFSALAAPSQGREPASRSHPAAEPEFEALLCDVPECVVLDSVPMPAYMSAASEAAKHSNHAGTLPSAKPQQNTLDPSLPVSHNASPTSVPREASTDLTSATALHRPSAGSRPAEAAAADLTANQKKRQRAGSTESATSGDGTPERPTKKADLEWVSPDVAQAFLEVLQREGAGSLEKRLVTMTQEEPSVSTTSTPGSGPKFDAELSTPKKMKDEVKKAKDEVKPRVKTERQIQMQRKGDVSAWVDGDVAIRNGASLAELSLDDPPMLVELDEMDDGKREPPPLVAVSGTAGDKSKAERAKLRQEQLRHMMELEPGGDGRTWLQKQLRQYLVPCLKGVIKKHTSKTEAGLTLLALCVGGLENKACLDCETLFSRKDSANYPDCVTPFSGMVNAGIYLLKGEAAHMVDVVVAEVMNNWEKTKRFFGVNRSSFQRPRNTSIVRRCQDKYAHERGEARTEADGYTAEIKKEETAARMLLTLARHLCGLIAAVYNRNGCDERWVAQIQQQGCNATLLLVSLYPILRAVLTQLTREMKAAGTWPEHFGDQLLPASLEAMYKCLANPAAVQVHLGGDDAKWLMEVLLCLVGMVKENEEAKAQLLKILPDLQKKCCLMAESIRRDMNINKRVRSVQVDQSICDILVAQEPNFPIAMRLAEMECLTLEALGSAKLPTQLAADSSCD